MNEFVDDEGLNPVAETLADELTSIANDAELQTGFRIMLFYNPAVTPYRLRLTTTGAQLIPGDAMPQSERGQIVRAAEFEMKNAVDGFIRKTGLVPLVKANEPAGRDPLRVGAKATNIRPNGSRDKTLLQMAVSFTKAHFFGTRVAPEVMGERWRICSGEGRPGEPCDDFRMTSAEHREGFCNNCGCGLKQENVFGNLAAFEQTKDYGCPRGLWPDKIKGDNERFPTNTHD